MPRATGWTLTELLITLAVAAVVLAQSVPDMTRLTADRAVQAEAQAFQSALRLARHEAMRLGEVVSICARDSRAGDSVHTCDADGRSWGAGWLVFVDRGQRGVMDAGDRVLLVHQSVQGSSHVQATLGRLSFQPTGISFSAASSFRFTPAQALTEEQALLSAQLVCVNKAGRARVSESAQRCT